MIDLNLGLKFASLSCGGADDSPPNLPSAPTPRSPEVLTLSLLPTGAATSTADAESLRPCHPGCSQRRSPCLCAQIASCTGKGSPRAAGYPSLAGSLRRSAAQSQGPPWPEAAPRQGASCLEQERPGLALWGSRCLSPRPHHVSVL